MSYTDRVRASEQRGLEQVYKDEKGVLRWKSNHYVAPLDLIKTAGFYDRLTPEEIIISKAALAAQAAQR